MTRGGTSSRACRAPWHHYAFAGLGVLLTAFLCIAEGSARDRGRRSGSRSYDNYEQQERSSRRYQRDMERQQAEQERSVRAMEQSSREAERNAAKIQAEMDEAQRRQQQQAERDAERMRREAERDAERMRQDTERQRQQAERERQQAERDAEARRQAERDAERARQDAERERRQAERQRQQAERERQQAEREEAQRQAARQDDWQGRRNADQARADADGTARFGDGDRQGSPRGSDDWADEEDADDDSADADDDAGLSDAERRVRELERGRRRALKAARRARAAGVDPPRDGRSDRSRPPGGAATDGGGTRRPARAGDGGEAPAKTADGNGKDGPGPAGDSKDETAGGDAETGSGRAGWLRGLQAQASRLGANLPDEDRDSGGAPASSRAADDGAGAGKATTAPGRGVRAPESRGVRTVDRMRLTFPGREKGAEMPADVYEQVRETELVVTDPSDDDVEKAKAQGFEVSAPTTLPGSGTSMRRLSLSGAGRSEAERELHKALPFLTVTPNYAYNIYVGSLGESEGAAGVPAIERRKAVPASAAPCPQSACFGGQLVKWKKALAACTKDVRIGIIDTSFDIDHPTFKNLKAVQGEFLDGTRPSPYDWHGTAVLSLLAGDPESGTPGLVPDATFLLATAFRSDVNGNASTDTVRLLAALAWLEQLDVDIVNMSFSGPKDPAFQRAIERMSKRGVVFIAAAGNMGPTAAPSYPAAYPNVVAVTAVNRNGANYKSANRGTYVDVSAPGVDILTALPKAKQGYRTGTSFAAPFVTAIVAAQGGDMGFAGREADLLKAVETQDLGPPGQDPIYGAGLVQAPPRCAPRPGPAVVSRVPDPEPAPASATSQPASTSAASEPARDIPLFDVWAKETTLIKAGAAGFAP